RGTGLGGEVVAFRVAADFDALQRGRGGLREGQAGGQGAWMVNNGYDRDMALRAVENGHADIVAFGKAFISNPDLVHRLHDDLPLNPWNSS
ncbi:hypothetical protein Q6251_29245, partial [Klebsiella quasipneumoniae]|nr:hypothetical protein [Klebsiella quasipneumoniae]